MAGFVTMVEFHWICLFRVPILGGEGGGGFGGEGVSKNLDIT